VHKAREVLEAAQVKVSLFSVSEEPTLDLVREGARLAKEMKASLIVGVGGGSVLDAAKAVAALATNSGDPLDYVEVIGAGKVLAQAPLPVIAVPTTAGTGAEVTRNAVLTSKEQKVKVSLRHPSMVPRVVILDPQLTLTVPPDVTASTGMDALCQLIEPFTCRTPNPFVDALCREGMKRAARSLGKAFRDGADLAAREDMMLAAHFSGLALANAKLGAVHGFAAPLGGMSGVAHGVLCAALLPSVIRVNLEALREREPAHLSVLRYQETARILTGNPAAKIEDAALFAENLAREMAIPRLKDLGVKKDDFDGICAKAAKASSTKGNPIDLTLVELRKILELAF